jgi:hypothetical protein
METEKVKYKRKRKDIQPKATIKKEDKPPSKPDLWCPPHASDCRRERFDECPVLPDDAGRRRAGHDEAKQFWALIDDYIRPLKDTDINLIDDNV